MSDEFVGTGDERSPATDDLGQATEESLIERMFEPETAPEPVAEPAEEVEETPVMESETEEVDEEVYEEVEETVNESIPDDSEEPEMFTVKIDGEEHTVNLEELKRGYSGQSYINTQMQKVAENRKETEQVFAALSQERAQVQAALQMLSDGTFAHPPQAPSEELFNTDPMAYMEQQLQYQKDQQAFQEKVGYMQQQAQANQQTQEQARHAYLAQEVEMLKGFHPELFDEQKGPEVKSQLVTQASENYGFSPEEINGVMDHRHMRVLMDAIAYRQLNSDAGKKQVEQKVKAKQVRSTKRKVNAESAQRQKQRERLKQTGSIDDAIGLLLE
jgi:hypothetical protein